MDIIKKANIKKLNLSDTEISIVKFIETNTRKFISMSISEVAKELYVSVATVSNLVNKIGYSGFKELKKTADHLYEKQKKRGLYDPMEEIENVNLFYIHSLEKTINNLDLVSVDRVVGKIIKAKKIITFGIGSSSLAAEEMANALNSVFINASSAKSIHDIPTWIDEKHKSSNFVMIFSKQTNSKELLFIINLLKEHKIPLVLITSNSKYVPSDNLDVIFFTTLEQTNRVFPLSSKIAEIFIVDVLALKLNNLIKKNHGNFYKDFQKLWRKK